MASAEPRAKKAKVVKDVAAVAAVAAAAGAGDDGDDGSTMQVDAVGNKAGAAVMIGGGNTGSSSDVMAQIVTPGEVITLSDSGFMRYRPMRRP